MIDTDKMKAAFAATPLCQMAWTEEGDGGSATKLCAISALVSFAGVQPALIQKMAERDGADTAVQLGWAGFARVPRWVADLALPVLRAEYGIPREVSVQFPPLFDGEENEWKGVTAVLALCERHNMDELHGEAMFEDAERFPQHGPAAPFMGVSVTGVEWHSYFTATPVKTVKQYPKQKPGQSKFWTATKTPVIAKKHIGGLAVL